MLLTIQRSSYIYINISPHPSVVLPMKFNVLTISSPLIGKAYTHTIKCVQNFDLY